MADTRVPDAVSEDGRPSFSDDERLARTMAIAMVTRVNRFTIALRTVPGTYLPDDPAIEHLRPALGS